MTLTVSGVLCVGVGVGVAEVVEGVGLALVEVALLAALEVVPAGDCGGNRSPD